MAAPNTPAQVLDHGIAESRLTIVTDHDPQRETTFHIPGDTLAKQGGVHSNDPCLYASTLNEALIDSVEAQHHTGIVFKSGDQVVGDSKHPAFHHISEDQTGGYHVVASKGHNDFTHAPVKIDMRHVEDENSQIGHDNLKYIKRSTRWQGNVGQTAQQLVAGLQTHQGQNTKGQDVSRVLVPVHGEHACTRALALNSSATEGPFAQYNTRNRKVVEVDGQPHVVVDHDDLMNIAGTLEQNLAPTTNIGKNGLTIHFKPLPNQKVTAKAGKVVIKMRLNRTPTSALLHDGEAESAPHNRITMDHASMALGGGDKAAPSNDFEASVKKQSELSKRVLNVSLSGASSAASAKTPTAAPTVTTLEDTAPAAGANDMSSLTDGGELEH